MKSLLIMNKIKVEKANTLGELIYGFPAISNFLGFTHSLSRSVQRKHNLVLGGCAVICHKIQVNAYQLGEMGDHVFSLSRNPLTKDGESPPFIEEGNAHMEVSLIIECDFTSEDFDFNTKSEKQDIAHFENEIMNQAITQRLAGGTIQQIDRVLFTELPEDSEELEKFTRHHLLKLLPGFVLVDRSDLLMVHYKNLKANNSKAELLDAWLDFVSLKYQAIPDEMKENETLSEQTSAKWERMAKPAGGWIVPITLGYKAISPLYENGQVACTRDNTTSFRFVESVYGVGEWLSPHRIYDLEKILWRYQTDGDYYLCKNIYHQLNS